MSLRDFLVWVRGHKSSTAGLALVIAGCLALVSLSRRVHHMHPKTAVPVSAMASGVVIATASDNPIVPTPSNAPATELDARTARMRGEFENATRDVDFIAQAMSRPQEGGKFYALLAWKRCNEIGKYKGAPQAVVSNEPFHDGAAALIEELDKRCTGVLEAYPSVQALYDVAMGQRGGKDFLMPVDGRGIVLPTGRDTAGADLDAALKTSDRWAAAEALKANADFVDVGNSTGDDGVDRQLHEWGAEVVACELVADCRGGVQASLHCVGTGDCAHDDYRDVVRARVPEANQAAFETLVVRMRQRMGLLGRPGAPD